MFGLNDTIDQLVEYRRRWEALAVAAVGLAPAESDAGRLVEVDGFGANPGNLRMLVHVPPGLPPEAPLVVALHGCQQSAGEFDRGAGWSDCADQHGFALLCPEQRTANNANRCFNWFRPEDTARGEGEVESIREMVDSIVANHGLDRRRLFVTGLSAGGAMAAALLATSPELFAGGAIIAGLPYGAAVDVREALDAMFQGSVRAARAWGDEVRAASAHAGPWPTVAIWHGSADSIVSPLNAAELAKQWTDVHGVPLDRSVVERSDGQIRRVWRNARGEAVVSLTLVDGLEHGVPIDANAADPARRYGRPGPYAVDARISSTEEIARSWHLTDAARPASGGVLGRAWRLIAGG